MELIFELLLDLILDGSIEISKNKKVSKLIRYPLIGIIVLFFLSVILLLFILGSFILKDNIYAGIFIIIVALILMGGSIYKFYELYMKRK